MTNSLTNYLSERGTALVAPSELASALQESADDATSSGGSGINYLSFSGSTGIYGLGPNKDEIDPDQLYLVGPQTFVGGWLCWKDSKRVGHVEWLATEAKHKAVARGDLEDHGPYRENAGEGWKQMLGFQLITMDNLKSEIKFSHTSTSARNSIGDLMKEIGARAGAAEPHIPLICFDKTTFDAQGFTQFKPVLFVEAWVTNEAALAYMHDELTEEQLIGGVKPKKKRASRKKK
jgi:hypothetical protein